MTDYRKTLTLPAEEMDDAVVDKKKDLKEVYSWVEASNSFPIIINGTLNYTVTITAGNYEYD